MKDSEEKSPGHFDRSPVGGAVVGTDYRLLEVNEALCRILGYTEQELLTMSFLDVALPGAFEPGFDAMRRLVNGEIRQFISEDLFIQKDGEPARGRISARLIGEGAGKPARILLQFEDVCEIGREVQSLRFQRDLALQMGSASSLPEAVDVLTEGLLQLAGIHAAGVYVFKSQTGRLHLLGHGGLSSDFAESVSCYDADAPLAGLVRSGAPIYRSSTRPFPAAAVELLGREGLKSFALIPFTDNERVVGSLYLASRSLDCIPETTRYILENMGAHMGTLISARRIQDAFKKSRDKHRDLFENALEGIFQSTPAGKFISVNPAFAKIHGYDSAEQMIKDVHDIREQLYVRQEDRDRILEKMKSDGCVLDFECEGRKRNGAKFWSSLNARCILDECGNVIRFEGFVTDITARRQLEEELRQARDKLESRVKQRTEELSDALHALEARETELAKRSAELKETNEALRVLLAQREQDRVELEENILHNVQQMIVPYIEKLKNTRLDGRQKMFIDLVESHLNEIISPFAKKLSGNFSNLTATELKVAELVKEGKSGKETAEILFITEGTVKFHKLNLRKKFGLKDKKTGLKAFLQSIHP